MKATPAALRPCRAFLTVAAHLGQIAEPCATCGHTMLLHPGFHNPALSACVLCSHGILDERYDAGTVERERRRVL